MSIDAMKQALAAIEAMLESINSPSLRQIPFDKNVQAMVALRAAIEQVQEPVAWMVYTLDGKSVCVTDNPADFTDQHKALPLYTAPRQWQGLTEAEKVNVATSCGCADVAWIDFADAIEARLREKNS